MAKLKQRVVELAREQGLDRQAFEPQPADWKELVAHLESDDAEGAARWVTRFELPVATLPVLALIRPLVSRLEGLAAHEGELWAKFRQSREISQVLARAAPATLSEAEQIARRRMELERQINQLRAGHNEAKASGHAVRALQALFAELFTGEPGAPRRDGIPAEVENAFQAAGIQLQWGKTWREVCRKPAEQRRRPGFRLVAR